MTAYSPPWSASAPSGERRTWWRPPPTKRGGLFGGLAGPRSPEPGDGRPVVLLGGTLSPGAAQGLAAELSRAGVEVAGAVPADEVADLPPLGEVRSWP